MTLTCAKMAELMIDLLNGQHGVQNGSAGQISVLLRSRNVHNSSRNCFSRSPTCDKSSERHT